MSRVDDGGPAFPETLTDWNPDVEEREVMSRGGLTVRDYFAAKALACIAAYAANGMHDMHAIRHKTPEEKLAADAYRLADAMLKARQA